MGSPPTICIVTPSLNQAAFIERTIRSVAAASSDRVDHRVIDGGSQDATVAILERNAGLVQFVSESDRGQSAAVNRGIRETSAEIVGWINSDDVYLEGALDVVRRVFAEDSSIDVVYGEADLIDVDDRKIGSYPVEPWSIDRLRDRCFLCQPATFVRRRVFESFGMLDESLDYCMDYEFWLRLARGGAVFRHLPRPLAAARLHPATKTSSRRIEVHAEINSMLGRMLGRVPDRWLCNYAHAVVDGLGIDRMSQRRRFLWQVSRQAWRASWRWNRRLSPSLVRTTAVWMGGMVMRG